MRRIDPFDLLTLALLLLWNVAYWTWVLHTYG